MDKLSHGIQMLSQQVVFSHSVTLRLLLVAGTDFGDFDALKFSGCILVLAIFGEYCNNANLILVLYDL